MRRSASTLLLIVIMLPLMCSPALAVTIPEGMSNIGDAAKVALKPDGVVIDCDDHSQVSLHVLAPNLVRVRASFQKQLPEQDHSWAVARTEWEPVPTKISEDKDAITVETSELKVVVNRKPLLVKFFDAHTGQLINSDEQSMQVDQGNGAVAATKAIAGEEHFYGLGEKAANLDKLHGKFQMWSSDTPGYKKGTDPIYQSIPFYIGLVKEKSDGGDWRGLAYGIFFDNSYRTHFDLGSSNPKHVVFESDGGDMNYYFFYGPSMKKVVARYTELTGRIPLPPKWALGNQQSRWSYSSEQEVKEIVNHFRKDNIPLDVIHLDIDYMNDYRVFTWNHERFPDPPGLMKWLASQGVKAVTILDPGVKYEPGGDYKVFNEGTAHNYFLKQKDGKPYVGKVWPGESVFVDYTLPEAAKWWGDLHSSLLNDGVSGIWNDMNEPADFEDRVGAKWKDIVNYDQGKHSKHAKMRNLFAMLECKATYEGLKRLRPDDRPYIITRSGYAGIQRYATMWTGDCNSTWDALALSIPMFETLGLCGESFVGADCGGFIGKSNGELLTRWYQVGFLSPFFRNHHEKGNDYQEPWRFGKQYEDIIRKYVQLRYRLLPHLYTVLAEAHETGMPWIRPLVLEYQNDKNVLSVDDEFMVGDKMLCAPVLTAGATSRDVYLPAGEWYDFFANKKYHGGRHITVQAPLDTVPLFVKAGSILPTGPVLNYVGQPTQEKITYEIFPDKEGAASGSLYEDDGKTQAYLNGSSEQFTLKFKNGKITSTSSKDKLDKSLPDASIKVHEAAAQEGTVGGI